MVFGGACWAGRKAEQEQRRRVQCLRALIAALKRAGQELTFSLAPLPELLGRLGEEEEGAVGRFFRHCGEYAGKGEGRFAEEWVKQAEELAAVLDGQAVATLERLGRELGRHGWEEEGRQLAAAVAELEEQWEEARETERRRGRLYRTLSAAAGMLLVLLLL